MMPYLSTAEANCDNPQFRRLRQELLANGRWRGHLAKRLSLYIYDRCVSRKDRMPEYSGQQPGRGLGTR